MILAYAIGILVLLILWFLYYLATGEKDFRKYFMGADGLLSTSKFQFFLWTIIVIFAYVTIFSARALNGDFDVISTLPENLLIAMGATVTTTATSKAIAVSKNNGKNLKNNDNKTENLKIRYLFKDDDDKKHDLSKIQMLAWTFIAIGIFIIRLLYEVERGNINIPDIDTALIVLMGLGQGAYLGMKLTNGKK